MPVFGAIAGIITAISSWTISLGSLGSFAVGNFLLRAAVDIGFNALFDAISGRNKKTPFGIQGTLRTGGTVPRSIIFGNTSTAGSLVYHNSWGSTGETPNAFYTQVIALADLPVDGFPGLFINGASVTLGATAHADYGYPITEYNKGGTDYLWVKFYDGNQTAADSFLVSKVSSAERPYENTRVGYGVAYVIVTSRIKEDLFTGFPSGKFIVNGTKFYDPSKDTSIGGSGLQRWNDPATWGGDGDHLPAVQVYNLHRGLTYGGKWFYGQQGVLAAQLPNAHWITQVEKCRDTITGTNGPEPTYRSGGEIPVSVEIGTAFENILAACAGRLSEIGGTYKIRVGAPDASVMSFTDDDIIADSPQKFTPFFRLSKTVNGVVAIYPNPAESYAEKSTPPVYNANYEVEDGGRRLLQSVSLPMVPYPEQAQRLVSSAMAEARRARRHTLTLPSRFWVLEPGDIVAWTSVRNGYSGKLFRIDGVLDWPNCDVALDLTEVDPTDFDWTTGADFVPPIDGGLVIVRPPSQSVKTFGVTVVDIQDSAAVSRRAGVNLSWDNAVDDVDGIMFEIRVKATSVVVSSPTTLDFSTGSYITEQGLVAAETYQARAKYVAGSARAVEWTAWVDFTTNDVRFGYDDLVPQIVTDIANASKIPVVTVLPADETTKGNLVFLTTNKLLYRWDDSVPEWTADVNATQIVGTLLAGQIGAGIIGANHMASNTLSAIFANIGTMTTGAPGEDRTIIDDNGLRVIDGDGGNGSSDIVRALVGRVI